MCNAYLNALASMLESEFSVSLRALKVGASKDILDTFLINFEMKRRSFIENTFYYFDQLTSATFCFIQSADLCGECWINSHK